MATAAPATMLHGGVKTAARAYNITARGAPVRYKGPRAVSALKLPYLDEKLTYERETNVILLGISRGTCVY